MKLLTLLTLIVCVATNQSCMTTYSAKGYPVQSVDPGVAVAGAVGAGILGFGLGALSQSYAPNYAYYESYGACGFRPYAHGHYSCY